MQVVEGVIAVSGAINVMVVSVLHLISSHNSTSIVDFSTELQCAVFHLM